MARRCPACSTTFEDAVSFCGHCGVITLQVQDPSDVDPRIGVQLGQYLVVARVADGAMGRVYEGRHPQTRQRVAIKVLHAHVAEDAVSVERFRREYETARDLDHPHVVRVLEMGQTPEGPPFMTMEFLEGEELGELLRREGALPMARALRIACQTALALEHAHGFGVIHRDLKPDNVFLCRAPEGDDVRLLDFGSVKLQVETGPKLTAFGTTLGSPYYMSPEQAMGRHDVDGRTDGFALAAIVYEMLTGKIAFEGATVAEILMKIVTGATPSARAVDPRIPASLDAVLQRGLAKDKTQRPAGPVALVTALLEAVGVRPDVAHWASRPQQELEAALATSTAVLAAPAVSSVPPPTSSAAPSHPSERPSRPAVRGAVLPGGAWMALIAVGLLVLAGGAAVVAFLVR
ncbi:MAG: protein kinase [Myxococcota bacterium]|nr:protein kinase [Myxococcota bacterium]MDW8362804.1 protein kinase [Myxococcales bacterium]